MQSLARATRTAVLARPKQPSAVFLRRRLASSDVHAHDEHHIEHHHDTTQYPKEDFFSSSWVYFLLLSAGAVGFYKFAPARGEEAYVTRYIAYYSTPSQIWERINTHHLLLSEDSRKGTLVIASAQRPPVHRYRYPQMLDQVSPHLQPIGMQVDVSGVVVKGDKD